MHDKIRSLILISVFLTWWCSALYDCNDRASRIHRQPKVDEQVNAEKSEPPVKIKAPQGIRLGAGGLMDSPMGSIIEDHRETIWKSFGNGINRARKLLFRRTGIQFAGVFGRSFYTQKGSVFYYVQGIFLTLRGVIL
jgi:hypothetical protein